MYFFGVSGAVSPLLPTPRVLTPSVARCPIALKVCRALGWLSCERKMSALNLKVSKPTALPQMTSNLFLPDLSIQF